MRLLTLFRVRSGQEDPVSDPDNAEPASGLHHWPVRISMAPRIGLQTKLGGLLDRPFSDGGLVPEGLLHGAGVHAAVLREGDVPTALRAGDDGGRGGGGEARARFGERTIRRVLEIARTSTTTNGRSRPIVTCPRIGFMDSTLDRDTNLPRSAQRPCCTHGYDGEARASEVLDRLDICVKYDVYIDLDVFVSEQEDG